MYHMHPWSFLCHQNLKKIIIRKRRHFWNFISRKNIEKIQFLQKSYHFNGAFFRFGAIWWSTTFKYHSWGSIAHKNDPNHCQIIKFQKGAKKMWKNSIFSWFLQKSTYFKIRIWRLFFLEVSSTIPWNLGASFCSRMAHFCFKWKLPFLKKIEPFEMMPRL